MGDRFLGFTLLVMVLLFSATAALCADISGVVRDGSLGAGIALRSGHVLRVPQDFDAAAVAQLIAAVASC